MRIAIIVATLAFVCAASSAEARQRHVAIDPGCNVLWPCDLAQVQVRHKRAGDRKTRRSSKSVQARHVSAAVPRRAAVRGARKTGAAHAASRGASAVVAALAWHGRRGTAAESRREAAAPPGLGAPSQRQRRSSQRVDHFSDAGKMVGITASWSSDLVSRARGYLGTNPTGWRALWCGRFMALIAPRAAAKLRNPNMARDWAELPHTSARIGTIVVLSRGRRGGHVGVVTGFDPRGNPIVVSGNHNKRVGEGVYDRRRVLAYVSP